MSRCAFAAFTPHSMLEEWRTLAARVAAMQLPVPTPIECWYIERFVSKASRCAPAPTLELSDPQAVEAAISQRQVGTIGTIICRHALARVYDLRAAVAGLASLLTPGGILVATVPAFQPVAADGDFWRFTSLSAKRLFAEYFAESSVQVDAFGNVLAAAAVLLNRPVAGLAPEELEYRDPDYEVVIGVRAVAPS